MNNPMFSENRLIYIQTSTPKPNVIPKTENLKKTPEKSKDKTKKAHESVDKARHHVDKIARMRTAVSTRMRRLKSAYLKSKLKATYSKLTAAQQKLQGAIDDALESGTKILDATIKDAMKAFNRIIHGQPSSHPAKVTRRREITKLARQGIGANGGFNMPKLIGMFSLLRSNTTRWEPLNKKMKVKIIRKGDQLTVVHYTKEKGRFKKTSTADFKFKIEGGKWITMDKDGKKLPEKIVSRGILEGLHDDTPTYTARPQDIHKGPELPINMKRFAKKLAASLQELKRNPKKLSAATQKTLNLILTKGQKQEFEYKGAKFTVLEDEHYNKLQVVSGRTKYVYTKELQTVERSAYKTPKEVAREKVFAQGAKEQGDFEKNYKKLKIGESITYTFTDPKTKVSTKITISRNSKGIAMNSQNGKNVSMKSFAELKMVYGNNFKHSVVKSAPKAVAAKKPATGPSISPKILKTKEGVQIAPNLSALKEQVDAMISHFDLKNGTTNMIRLARAIGKDHANDPQFKMRKATARGQLAVQKAQRFFKQLKTYSAKLARGEKVSTTKVAQLLKSLFKKDGEAHHKYASLFKKFQKTPGVKAVPKTVVAKKPAAKPKKKPTIADQPAKAREGENPLARGPGRSRKEAMDKKRAILMQLNAKKFGGKTKSTVPPKAAVAKKPKVKPATKPAVAKKTAPKRMDNSDLDDPTETTMKRIRERPKSS